MNPSTIQKQAEEYVKTHRIDTLIKEMLNSTLTQNTEKPIVSMIKYLSQFVPEGDMIKAGIKMNVEKYGYNPLMKYFNFPDQSTLIIKRFLTPTVYDKLKNTKTKLGGHISHIIKTALSLDNKETVGLVLTDGDCYKKMTLLVKQAIEFLHSYDAQKSLFNYSNTNQIEDSTYESNLFSYLKIKLSRNLSDFPYLPYAQEHTRKAICDKIVNTLQEMYPNGHFIDLDNTEFNTLNDIYFDKELNFISAGLVKDNCGIFIPNDSKLLIKKEEISNTAFLINFNDHLQIIRLNNKLNIRSTFEEIMKVSDNLNKKLVFDHSDEYGYLTNCPSNSGSAIKLSAFLKVSKLINDGNTALLLNKWSIRAKKNLTDDSNDEYEFLSKCKQGVDVTAFINSFIIKIISLINFENKLIENNGFVMKKSHSLQSNFIKSTYEFYYDSYKLVSTDNGKYLFFFNDQFANLFNKELRLIVEDELIPTDYKSLHIYADFYNDYIANATNIFMLDLKKKENIEKKRVEYQSVNYDQISDIKVQYELYRNFQRLNFFNSNQDKDNLLSVDTFNHIKEKISHKFKFDAEENFITIHNSNTHVYFALENHINNTKGNHVLLKSDSIDVLNDIAKMISEIEKYKIDDIYGYVTRNILYSGPAIKISLFLSIDNKDKIILPDEFSMTTVDDKIVVTNNFSLSLSQQILSERIKELLEKIKK